MSEILSCPSSCRGLENELKHNSSNVSLTRHTRLLLRLQPAILYLVNVWLVYGVAWPFISAWPAVPAISTFLLIFWDLITFTCAGNRGSRIPVEVNLLLELIFLGIFIYLELFNADIIMLGHQAHRPDLVPGLYLQIIQCSFVLFFGLVYIYLDLRAYLAHRQYRRDCRLIKPLIAFTEEGGLVAVFPSSQEINLQRLSVDSLQEAGDGQTM